MSLFGKILSKLGLKKGEADTASAAMGQQASKPAAAAKPAAPASKPVAAKSAASASAPIADKREDFRRPAAAVPMVDVTSKLETMAKGTNLDWKVSIVDLLKVLGLDSSLEARKELAQELGCPPELMGGDSAKMNVWLHKTVLAKIAENGGNIPKELLD